MKVARPAILCGDVLKVLVDDILVERKKEAVEVEETILVRGINEQEEEEEEEEEEVKRGRKAMEEALIETMDDQSVNINDKYSSSVAPSLIMQRTTKSLEYSGKSSSQH